MLFRDYGLYDHAMLRFAPGHKISENFYVRQDGTRAYYFTTGELLFMKSHIQSCFSRNQRIFFASIFADFVHKLFTESGFEKTRERICETFNRKPEGGSLC